MADPYKDLYEETAAELKAAYRRITGLKASLKDKQEELDEERTENERLAEDLRVEREERLRHEPGRDEEDRESERMINR